MCYYYNDTTDYFCCDLSDILPYEWAWIIMTCNSNGMNMDSNSIREKIIYLLTIKQWKTDNLLLYYSL